MGFGWAGRSEAARSGRSISVYLLLSSILYFFFDNLVFRTVIGD
jgi:hypothetical protein